MPTLQAYRNRVIVDLGLGLTMSSIDSITSTTLVISSYFRNLNWGTGQFRDWTMHRPDTVTAADVIRYAGDLNNATGAITPTGAAYTDIVATSETFNLLKIGVRPDQDIDPAINEALEHLVFATTEPLSMAPDAAMRETGFASWGTLVNATAAKQTTAARVFPGMGGIRSAAITCTSANGYQPTVPLTVTPGEQVLIGAICRVNSGTSATITPRDLTNGANFTSGTIPVHSERTWQYMQYLGTVPSGCRSMEIRLQGVGASDVVDWACLWFVRSSVNRFNLPTGYLSERFMLNAITAVGFGMSTPGVTGTVMQGLSIDTAEIPDSDYSPAFPLVDANPGYVQFHGHAWRNYWQRATRTPYSGGGVGNFPLAIQMHIPYSERGALSLESDTSGCPLHLGAAAAAYFLLYNNAEYRGIAAKSLEQAHSEYLQAARIRTSTGPARRRPAYVAARAPN